MKRIFLGLVAAVLLAVPTLVAQAQSSITLTPPKYEFDADPGQVIRDTIRISNQGTDTLVLNSVVEDFVASGETGQPSFVGAGESDPSISISSWVIVNDNQPVTIAPGGRTEVPFVVNVPTDGEPGGHYGAIFFAPPSVGEGQVGINQRIGSLLLVRVRGEISESGELATFGSYPADMPGEQIADTGSQSFFEQLPVPFAIRYENTGNIHVKPQGSIEIRNTLGQTVPQVGVLTITDEQGLEVTKEIVDYIPVNDIRGNVLASSVRTFRAEWRGTPYWYQLEDGTREIRYQGYPVGLYTAELTLTGAGGEQVTETVRFIVFPWKEIFGGIVLAILLIFGGIRFSRWRARVTEEAFKKKYGVQ